MLKRMTLQVGNSPIGSCESSENPSNINSCSSCLMMVGVLVKKFVGGDIVILKIVQYEAMIVWHE